MAKGILGDEYFNYGDIIDTTLDDESNIPSLLNDKGKQNYAIPITGSMKKVMVNPSTGESLADPAEAKKQELAQRYGWKFAPEDEGFIKEVGKGLARGVFGAPAIVGRTLDVAGEEAGIQGLRSAGKAMYQWAEEMQDAQPLMRGKNLGFITDNFVQAAEMIPEIAGMGMAGAAVGGPVGSILAPVARALNLTSKATKALEAAGVTAKTAGRLAGGAEKLGEAAGATLGIAGPFGVAEYSRKYEEIKAKNPSMPDEEARALAKESGMYETVGELIGTPLELMTAGWGRVLINPTKASIKAMLTPGWRNALKSIAATGAIESGTEAWTSYGQAGVDQKAGLSTMSQADAALAAVIPSLIVSSFFGVAGRTMNKMQRNKIIQTLSTPATTTQQLMDQVGAINFVKEHLATQDKQLAEEWNYAAHELVRGGHSIPVDPTFSDIVSKYQSDKSGAIRDLTKMTDSQISKLIPVVTNLTMHDLPKTLNERFNKLYELSLTAAQMDPEEDRVLDVRNAQVRDDIKFVRGLANQLMNHFTVRKTDDGTEAVPYSLSEQDLQRLEELRVTNPSAINLAIAEEARDMGLFTAREKARAELAAKPLEKKALAKPMARGDQAVFLKSQAKTDVTKAVQSGLTSTDEIFRRLREMKQKTKKGKETMKYAGIDDGTLRNAIDYWQAKVAAEAPTIQAPQMDMKALGESVEDAIMMTGGRDIGAITNHLQQLEEYKDVPRQRLAAAAGTYLNPQANEPITPPVPEKPVKQKQEALKQKAAPAAKPVEAVAKEKTERKANVKKGQQQKAKKETAKVAAPETVVDEKQRREQMVREAAEKLKAKRQGKPAAEAGDKEMQELVEAAKKIKEKKNKKAAAVPEKVVAKKEPKPAKAKAAKPAVTKTGMLTWKEWLIVEKKQKAAITASHPKYKEWYAEYQALQKGETPAKPAAPEVKPETKQDKVKGTKKAVAAKPVAPAIEKKREAAVAPETTPAQKKTAASTQAQAKEKETLLEWLKDNKIIEFSAEWDNASVADRKKWYEQWKKEAEPSIKKAAEHVGEAFSELAQAAKKIGKKIGKTKGLGFAGGQVFDEEMYQELKPHMEKAWKAFSKAAKVTGETILKWMEKAYTAFDSAGLDPDEFTDYFVRFQQDLVEGNVIIDDKPVKSNLENVPMLAINTQRVELIGKKGNKLAGVAVDATMGSKHVLASPFTVKGRETKETMQKYEDYFRKRVAEDSDFRAAVLSLSGKRLGTNQKKTVPHYVDVIIQWLRENESQYGPAADTRTKEFTPQEYKEQFIRRLGVILDSIVNTRAKEDDKNRILDAHTDAYNYFREVEPDNFVKAILRYATNKDKSKNMTLFRKSDTGMFDIMATVLFEKDVPEIREKLKNDKNFKHVVRALEGSPEAIQILKDEHPNLLDARTAEGGFSARRMFSLAHGSKPQMHKVNGKQLRQIAAKNSDITAAHVASMKGMRKAKREKMPPPAYIRFRYHGYSIEPHVDITEFGPVYTAKLFDPRGNEIIAYSDINPDEKLRGMAIPLTQRKEYFLARILRDAVNDHLLTRPDKESHNEWVKVREENLKRENAAKKQFVEEHINKIPFGPVGKLAIEAANFSKSPRLKYEKIMRSLFSEYYGSEQFGKNKRAIANEIAKVVYALEQGKIYPRKDIHKWIDTLYAEQAHKLETMQKLISLSDDENMFRHLNAILTSQYARKADDTRKEIQITQAEYVLRRFQEMYQQAKNLGRSREYLNAVARATQLSSSIIYSSGKGKTVAEKARDILKLSDAVSDQVALEIRSWDKNFSELSSEDQGKLQYIAPVERFDTQEEADQYIAKVKAHVKKWAEAEKAWNTGLTETDNFNNLLDISRSTKGAKNVSLVRVIYKESMPYTGEPLNDTVKRIVRMKYGWIGKLLDSGWTYKEIDHVFSKYEMKEITKKLNTGEEIKVLEEAGEIYFDIETIAKKRMAMKEFVQYKKIQNKKAASKKKTEAAKDKKLIALQEKIPPVLINSDQGYAIAKIDTPAWITRDEAFLAMRKSAAEGKARSVSLKSKKGKYDLYKFRARDGILYFYHPKSKVFFRYSGKETESNLTIPYTGWGSQSMEDEISIGSQMVNEGISTHLILDSVQRSDLNVTQRTELLYGVRTENGTNRRTNGFEQWIYQEMLNRMQLIKLRRESGMDKLSALEEEDYLRQISEAVSKEETDTTPAEKMPTKIEAETLHGKILEAVSQLRDVLINQPENLKETPIQKLLKNSVTWVEDKKIMRFNNNEIEAVAGTLDYSELITIRSGLERMYMPKNHPIFSATRADIDHMRRQSSFQIAGVFMTINDHGGHDIHLPYREILGDKVVRLRELGRARKEIFRNWVRQEYNVRMSDFRKMKKSMQMKYLNEFEESRFDPFAPFQNEVDETYVGFRGLTDAMLDGREPIPLHIANTAIIMTKHQGKLYSSISFDDPNKIFTFLSSGWIHGVLNKEKLQSWGYKEQQIGEIERLTKKTKEAVAKQPAITTTLTEEQELAVDDIENENNNDAVDLIAAEQIQEILAKIDTMPYKEVLAFVKTLPDEVRQECEDRLVVALGKIHPVKIEKAMQGGYVHVTYSDKSRKTMRAVDAPRIPKNAQFTNRKYLNDVQVSKIIYDAGSMFGITLRINDASELTFEEAMQQQYETSGEAEGLAVIPGSLSPMQKETAQQEAAEVPEAENEKLDAGLETFFAMKAEEKGFGLRLTKSQFSKLHPEEKQKRIESLILNNPNSWINRFANLSNVQITFAPVYNGRAAINYSNGIYTIKLYAKQFDSMRSVHIALLHELTHAGLHRLFGAGRNFVDRTMDIKQAWAQYGSEFAGVLRRVESTIRKNTELMDQYKRFCETMGYMEGHPVGIEEFLLNKGVNYVGLFDYVKAFFYRMAKAIGLPVCLSKYEMIELCRAARMSLINPQKASHMMAYGTRPTTGTNFDNVMNRTDYMSNMVMASELVLQLPGSISEAFVQAYPINRTTYEGIMNGKLPDARKIRILQEGEEDVPLVVRYPISASHESLVVFETESGEKRFIFRGKVFESLERLIIDPQFHVFATDSFGAESKAKLGDITDAATHLADIFHEQRSIYNNSEDHQFLLETMLMPKTAGEFAGDFGLSLGQMDAMEQNGLIGETVDGYQWSPEVLYKIEVEAEKEGWMTPHIRKPIPNEAIYGQLARYDEGTKYDAYSATLDRIMMSKASREMLRSVGSPEIREPMDVLRSSRINTVIHWLEKLRDKNLGIATKDISDVKRFTQLPTFLQYEHDKYREVIQIERRTEHKQYQTAMMLKQKTPTLTTFKPFGEDQRQLDLLDKILVQQQVLNGKSFTDAELSKEGLNDNGIKAFHEMHGVLQQVIKDHTQMQEDALFRDIHWQHAFGEQSAEIKILRAAFETIRKGKTPLAKDFVETESWTNERIKALNNAMAVLNRGYTPIREMRVKYGERSEYFPLSRPSGDFYMYVLRVYGQPKDVINNAIAALEAGKATSEVINQFGVKVQTEWSRQFKTEADARNAQNYVNKAVAANEFDIAANEGVWASNPRRQNLEPSETYFMVADLNLQRVFNNAVHSIRHDDKGLIDKDTAQQLLSVGAHIIADNMLERGAGRHTLRRNILEKGPRSVTLGFETENLRQVFYDYVRGFYAMKAKYEASMEYVEALKGVRKEEANVYNDLSQYASDMLAPGNKLQGMLGKLKGFAFSFYLAGKISSAALQLTQNFVTGAPFLAREGKKYGSGYGIGQWSLKADKETMKALKRAGALAYRLRNDKSIDDLVNKEEGALLRLLWDRGAMQAQFVNSLLSQSSTAVGYGWKKAVYLLGSTFSIAEEMNRVTAALSFIAMHNQMGGMSKFGDIEGQFQAMERFIDKTHYWMGKGNQPKFARGNDPMAQLANASMTFRRFNYNYFNSLYYAMAKDVNEEGKSVAGFDVAIRSLAYLSLFGGLFAIPFLDDLLELFEKLTGVPYRAQMKKNMRQVGGKGFEQFGAGGIGTIIGIDFKGPLKIGIPFYGDKDDTLYGVWTGLVKKAAKATGELAKGDVWRGIENASPLFLENMAKAARINERGAITPEGFVQFDREGRPFKFTDPETFWQAMGFKPVRYAEEMEAHREYKVMSQNYQEKRNSIYTAFRLAKTPSELAEARKEAMKYNLSTAKIRNLVPAIKVEQLDKMRQKALSEAEKKEMIFKKTFML